MQTTVTLNREEWSKLLDETMFRSGRMSLRMAEKVTGVPYVCFSKNRRGSISVDTFMAIAHYIHRTEAMSYDDIFKRVLKKEIN